jgi:hypothetical protein
VARQNVNTAGGGLTGPVCSLIQSQKTNISSITAGAGISVIGSGTTGVTIALAFTGPGITTIGCPASVTLNAYGQVTFITGGTGSVNPLSGLTAATAYQHQLVIYNTTTHALSYAAADYSCVFVDTPTTFALDPTTRGGTYIVTGLGNTAARTITFTHVSLSANAVVCLLRVLLAQLGSHRSKRQRQTRFFFFFYKKKMMYILSLINTRSILLPIVSLKNI